MENNLDKLFKSGLEGKDPEFHPAAWDRMEVLLEEEGLTAIKKDKPRRVGFILPFLLLGVLISIIVYVKMNPNEVLSGGSTLTDSTAIISALDQDVNKSNAIESQTKLGLNKNKKVQYENEVESNSPDSKSESFKQLHNNALNPVTNNFQTSKNGGTDKKKINFDPAKPKTIDNESFVTDHFQANQINTDAKKVEEGIIGKEKDKLDTEYKLLHSSISNNKNLSYASEDITGKARMPVAKDDRLISIGLISTLSFSELLNYKSEKLIAPSVEIIPPLEKFKSSFVEIGIDASIRTNNGLGYSIGPFFSYNVGKGYSLSFSGQYDVQKFNSGPEFSVYDKEYSFGSTLTERKFSLDHQKSIRIPITLRKSFDKFDARAGLIFYQTMMSSGDIATSSDGSTEPGQSIDNQMIKPNNVAILLEGEIKLNRYLQLGLGLEYKPKAFSEGQTTANNQNTYYPTLGLRYSFFNF